MIDLQSVIDDLLSRETQDPGRLTLLAEYLVERFGSRGLRGLRGGKASEIGIRGLARRKDWDLSYLFSGKPRLLISLKSILRNLSGTIPNRIDDLMGEVANVQQYSPELVIGYVCVLDEAGNSRRKEDGDTWIDYFMKAVGAIAIRKAPLWNQGLLEGAWIIRIDSRLSSGDRVIGLEATVEAGEAFVESLLTELRLREPAIFQD